MNTRRGLTLDEQLMYRSINVLEVSVILARGKCYNNRAYLENQVPDQTVNTSLWPSGIYSAQCMSVVDCTIRGREAEY